MSIIPYGRDLFDDFKSPLENLFKSMDFRPEIKNFMSTDVIEKEDGLELIMDLPGTKKDDIKIELEDGYLTITASGNSSKEEKSDDGHTNYLRRERYSGQYTRSFFVGENLTDEDIKARFENGTLTLNFPKNEDKKLETKKFINIEG